MEVVELDRLPGPYDGNINNQHTQAHPQQQPHHQPPFNGVFGLLCVNLAVFCLDHLVELEGMRGFYLYQHNPWVHQLITSLFCHASYAHLSSNLFFIFIFGRIVEERRGSWGIVAVFLTCGICANLVTLLTPYDVKRTSLVGVCVCVCRVVCACVVCRVRVCRVVSCRVLCGG
jgi:membrane associated rhomboid family serine protease